MITTDSNNFVVGGNLTAPITVYGLAADSKPTANIANGSIFIEIDTGKVYFFNAAGAAWVEQFSFQS